MTSTDEAAQLAAFEALTKSKTNKDRIARYKERAEVYLAAMSSPRPQVRALGAAGAPGPLKIWPLAMTR